MFHVAQSLFGTQTWKERAIEFCGVIYLVTWPQLLSAALVDCRRHGHECPVDRERSREIPIRARIQLREVNTRKSNNLARNEGRPARRTTQTTLSLPFETHRNCHARETNLAGEQAIPPRQFVGASSSRRIYVAILLSRRKSEGREVSHKPLDWGKLIRSNGSTRRDDATHRLRARKRCVQIELAPRNATTDSRDRHGETERQRRAHARHAYCSEPSQSRSRPLSVPPATAESPASRDMRRRAPCLSHFRPVSLARRTSPNSAAAPPSPHSRYPRVRFIENPYLRFFLTSIAYIRGSQTSRRNHVVFCLLTKPTRI